jgi:hypothetical protein
MVDINFINFPKAIGPVESGKPDAARVQPTGAQGVDFENHLMQALGQISQEADQVAEASSSSYENVQDAMDQAKNAFSDTMQTHQMMQYFLMNSMQKQNAPEAGADSQGVE